MRVVVIDDNRDAAESLGMVLELAGYEVTVSTDSGAGLELARRLRPDAVISDIGMPGLTGLDVARALRADPATTGIRLISVSGYGTDEDRKKAREAGFDVTLVKPVELGQLHQLLSGFAVSGGAAAGG